MKPIYVTGVGAWLAADTAEPAPPAELLAAGVRRRAPPLARMVAEVTARALGSGATVSRPIILGSAYGEIATAVAMMESFRGEEGLPSPTRFHNSVHNTGVAYLSIATSNHSPSTAIAAGHNTSALAILEAWALLEDRGGSVLVVLADEVPPGPFQPVETFRAAAVAFSLSDEPGPGVSTRLRALRRGPGSAPRISPDLQHHPCAGGFRLAAAIEHGLTGAVPLGPAGDVTWVVDVDRLSA